MPPDAGGLLRVATLNLCSGRGPDGSHLSSSALAAALSELDADVVSLQEVDRDQPRSGSVDQAAVAADALGATDSRFAPALVGTHEPMTPGTRRSWTASPAVALDVGGAMGGSAVDVGRQGDVGRAADGGGSADGVPAFGIAVLSRRPVLRWEVLSLGSGRAALPLRVPDPRTGRMRLFWFPDEPRVALAAVLDGVTVVGTHLSFSPPTSWGQLGRLRRWAATLPGPVVLAGDLNLPGPVVRRRTGGRLLARTPTFPGPDPRLQLDHVVALGRTPVRSSGVSARQLDVGDHRAVAVDVELSA